MQTPPTIPAPPPPAASRFEREVPVPESSDPSELERELETYRTREQAVRVQLAAVVNAGHALEAKDRTLATVSAALTTARKRALQGLAIYDGARPGAASKA
ncbi:MAG: hypothetical protein ACJ768_02590 [Gaiellaceae bacterium]